MESPVVRDAGGHWFHGSGYFFSAGVGEAGVGAGAVCHFGFLRCPAEDFTIKCGCCLWVCCGKFSPAYCSVLSSDIFFHVSCSVVNVDVSICSFRRFKGIQPHASDNPMSVGLKKDGLFYFVVGG